MRIKICGINTPEALAAATEAGTDYVGLVFFPRSPRAVTAAQAAGILNTRPRGPQRVGLFVNPSPDEIASVLEKIELDALQFYGVPDLSPFRHFGKPLWRAHGVSTQADLPIQAAGADELVIEAKPPANAARPGGNAIRFDWTITATWQAPASWWLAGGLTPENVAKAIRLSGAAAVDVSSGVESSPGVKDPAKIWAFIEAARR